MRTEFTDFVPAALITHTTAAIRGLQRADISVHHARTTDARISMTFTGIHMTIYSCDAAQGLLEAFDAARGHMANLPREIPSPRAESGSARIALALEWTRRPQYAVLAQTAPNKAGTAAVHWLDLYTGPVTWQIRDQIGLKSTIALLTQVHRTAAAVFLDAAEHSADPTIHVEW
ncbi:hypothetical protein [Mycolicibacterium arenosum]|uniref:Uncharacterized protein n=1 Tax=Mycolicibacterium arenosum TaxID=2952157 RepID=A0ABT1MEG9_9MYCO|nr:hypothetical protein [Mycolicibacterium sp. CAU 1645]MCP9276797.1 hypothetical protein [Mycolicibacterium sp. CAU 1645]